VVECDGGSSDVYKSVQRIFSKSYFFGISVIHFTVRTRKMVMVT